MTIRGAAVTFNAAQNQSSDPAVRQLAQGLNQLALSLARELDDIKSKVDDLQRKINSMR